MGKKVTQPTVEAAMENVIQETPPVSWWTDGSSRSEPAPADTPQGDVEKVLQMMRDEVQKACEKYDLPFDADKVHCVVVDSHYAYGSCTPVGCGTYESLQGEWRVEKKPEKYVVYMPVSAINRRERAARKTVRHELAHAADWEENLRTTEQTHDHREWLMRLEAAH